jgi:hypothetical protein
LASVRIEEWHPCCRSGRTGATYRLMFSPPPVQERRQGGRGRIPASLAVQAKASRFAS